MKGKRDCVCMANLRNAYKILVKTPEGKRLLARSIHRWEDNIKTDLKEPVWEIVKWIHLAQQMQYWWAYMNMVMNC
jgi:hypothetical protein